MKTIAAAKAKEEAKKELGEEVEQIQEEKEENEYQEMLLTMKARLGLITQEKLEEIQAQRRKR